MNKTKEIIKYIFKCPHCYKKVPKTHSVYSRVRTYQRAVQDNRKVFCSKGCGTAFRHANMTKAQKEAYIAKIVKTRTNRASAEKEASANKYRETASKFSKEKREDIRRRTYETKATTGVQKKATAKTLETLERKYGKDYGKKRAKKASKTMQKRYGVTNALLKESPFRDKADNTMLEKYGTKHPTKNKGILAKVKATMEERHGGVGWASPTVKAKYEKTLRKKYGVANPAQHPEISRRSGETYKKEGVKKAWATKVKNGTTPDKVYYKGHETKKRNGSYKVNKSEQFIMDKLQKIFPKIQYQVLDIPNYPFNADFYDKKTNTVFEYQGYFTHGKEPFNARKKSHRVLLADLLADTSGKWAPKVTAKVWGVSDPLKRKTAKKFNINFVEWFTLQEFEEWFENQKRLIKERRKQ